MNFFRVCERVFFFQFSEQDPMCLDSITQMKKCKKRKRLVYALEAFFMIARIPMTKSNLVHVVRPRVRGNCQLCLRVRLQTVYG